MREDPLDKVLADSRVAEAPFLLDRQMGKALEQRRGEQTAPVA